MLRPLPLQVDVSESLEQTFAEFVAFLPRLIGALVILLVGWIVGRLVYRAIVEVTDRVTLDERVSRTPLGRMFGEDERAVAGALGTLGAWFVYALAILAAANVLAITVLSEWLTIAVSYLPALVAGVLIIVVGFVLADFLADVVARTETLTGTRYTDAFADGLRVFLYFVAIVIALDTIGVDVEILYTFATAAAWGLAAGIALAIGIGFGWGGKDFVADNIDDWFSRRPRRRSDRGTTTGDDS